MLVCKRYRSQNSLHFVCWRLSPDRPKRDHPFPELSIPSILPFSSFPDLPSSLVDSWLIDGFRGTGNGIEVLPNSLNTHQVESHFPVTHESLLKKGLLVWTLRSKAGSLASHVIPIPLLHHHIPPRHLHLAAPPHLPDPGSRPHSVFRTCDPPPRPARARDHWRFCSDLQ
jgi:hypothetical protein